MSVHVFGIRHHGPGSARSVRRALEQLAPDLLLIEGPPEADSLLPLAADPAMRPPVALLVYPVEAPRHAVFYPFAEFSPEWQAVRYGLAQNIPVRFMDLPLAIRFARDAARRERNAADQAAQAVQADQPEQPDHARDDDGTTDANDANDAIEVTPAVPRPDPIGMLAEAAGYADSELWWEQQVERRFDPAGMFDAIREAMQAVRDASPPLAEDEALREAAMRQAIRAARKEGFARIAVVCGAWHAPALADPGPAAPDVAALKGQPKAKVDVTWVPWTYSRLSYRSGYGAGVESPGWYHHVWIAPDRAPIRWLVDSARLLRAADLEAPSASVIEAVRLADALASMRDLGAPGLAELREATRSVLCHGEDTPLQLIRDRLEIGGRLGAVPESVTQAPLQRDLHALQKSLRLKVSDEARELDLDLRKDIDRERSRLFHRLGLIDVSWATAHAASGVGAGPGIGSGAAAAGASSKGGGTFHELWTLRWRPEMEVSLIEASVWGHTVADASAARARHEADTATDLDAVALLLDRVILAGLPDALDHVLAQLQARAALSSDVLRLMAALAPLTRALRYGDVRGTPVAHLRPIIDGLFARILVGLPFACASLDDEAASAMVDRMQDVDRALDLLDDAEAREAWAQALDQLRARETVHGLVRGRCCRLLFEQQRLDDAELQRAAGLALSPAVPAPQAAAWIDGLLRGSGLLLHQDGLWLALDRWLTGLSADTFREMLPLVRRAFGSFGAAERRAMGDKVRRITREGGAPAIRKAPASSAAVAIDPARAARVLPVLARLLGVE